MKHSIKHFKYVVFIVRQTRVLAYFFKMPFFIFNLLSSTPFAADKQWMKDSKFGLTFWLNLHSLHLKTHVIPSTDWYLSLFLQQMKSTWCWSALVIPVLEEAAETIWRAVNTVSTYRNTFNFFDYLVIFRHYFTGWRVSCILASISNWFPNIKI